MAARLDQGAVLVSATNGKTTTSAMVAAILERSGRSASCTTAPARTWAGAWPPRCWTPAAGRASSGLFEVDEAWLPRVADAVGAAQPSCSRTCSATSSTATASWSCWRTAWAELVDRLRRAGARFVLNADDPLVADLGRGREGVVYFGVADDSQALPGAPARGRLQALPQLRRAVRLRGVLPGPPRPLPLPQLRPRAARAGGRGGASGARRACPGPGRDAGHPGGQARR